MKWLLKTVLFALSFATLAHASEQECTAQNFKFHMHKGATVSTDFYSSVSPRGVFVFISGPEARYQGSQDYIEKLCQRGFSVAAFNIIGKKVQPKDYLWAAHFVSHHIEMSFPSLPISVYGWSRGADIAVKLGSLPRAKFQNVILDSPLLTRESKSVLLSGQIRRVKIFACSTDPKESYRNLKKLSYGAKVFLTNKEECGHRLSTSPEVEDKLIDFIETDFRNPNNTFWLKI
jgi:alpha-beta hydrolase superfamily lysophospholipase